jgi:hypothetical protein
VTTVVALFVVVSIGCGVACANWLHDFSAPQMALLGSGNRLSLFVSDGPARLVLATGDDPIGYENALARFRPLFARRLDVLLVAGSGRALLAPVTAMDDRHVRSSAALAPLPSSPESDALGNISAYLAPKTIRLGPTIAVTVETALPFGADPKETFPAWRATIQHGETRVVVLSDGEAATLFTRDEPAAILVVSGQDPAAAWKLFPAVALIANADAIAGPELRATISGSRQPPRWGFRVASGEALRVRFVPGGVELPTEPAQGSTRTPATATLPRPPALAFHTRRRGPHWRGWIRS